MTIGRTSAATPGRRLPYHRASADADYWAEHWASESFEHLLEVAHHSELTRWLERRLVRGSRVLEAGCGLGQYVALLRMRGYEVTGVDYVADALDRHRGIYPDSPLVAADLAALPFPDASFDAYISLGVIEHSIEPPWTLLAEASRVLTDDGILLLSVPYLNLSRKVLARRIRAAERRRVRAGARFHQYAFDEEALDGILRGAGFRILGRGYYDPGRGVRDVKALFSAASDTRFRKARNTDGFGPRVRPHSPAKRRLLYAMPVLRLLAHMQIVHAVKDNWLNSRR